MPSTTITSKSVESPSSRAELDPTDLPEFLVVGSLNQDEFIRAERDPEDDDSVWTSVPTTVAAGGHGGNVAAALALLGHRVQLIASVGLDAVGDRLLADLECAGVDGVGISRSTSEPSGRVFVCDLGGRRFMVMDRGANSDLSTAHVFEQTRRYPDATLVLCDPPAEVARAVLRSASDRFAIFSPGGELISDESLCRQLTSRHWLVANEVELRRAFGPDLGPPSSSVAGIVETMGSRGASIWQSAASEHVDAVETEEVDATGAGDAFTAGFASGLRRFPSSVRGAAELGARVGAACVQTSGARLVRLADM